TAATNFAPWSKRSLNEKEVHNAKPVQVQTQKTPRHCGAPASPDWRGDCRLRRSRRAKHEAISGAPNRPSPARRRSCRNYRVQCPQNTPIDASIVTVDQYPCGSAARNKTASGRDQFHSAGKDESQIPGESLRFGKNL